MIYKQSANIVGSWWRTQDSLLVSKSSPRLEESGWLSYGRAEFWEIFDEQYGEPMTPSSATTPEQSDQSDPCLYLQRLARDIVWKLTWLYLQSNLLIIRAFVTYQLLVPGTSYNGRTLLRAYNKLMEPRCVDGVIVSIRTSVHLCPCISASDQNASNWISIINLEMK